MLSRSDQVLYMQWSLRYVFQLLLCYSPFIVALVSSFFGAFLVLGWLAHFPLISHHAIVHVGFAILTIEI